MKSICVMIAIAMTVAISQSALAEKAFSTSCGCNEMRWRAETRSRKKTSKPGVFRLYDSSTKKSFHEGPFLFCSLPCRRYIPNPAQGGENVSPANILATLGKINCVQSKNPAGVTLNGGWFCHQSQTYRWWISITCRLHISFSHGSRFFVLSIKQSSLLFYPPCENCFA